MNRQIIVNLDLPAQKIAADLFYSKIKVRKVDLKECLLYNIARTRVRRAFFKETAMIRKIEKKDRETFLRFSEQFYASPAVAHDIPKEYHARAFDELMRSNEYAEGFMVEADGKSVGFALTAKTYSREAGGKVLWLEELFILEEYRSRGLGREYFAYIENYAKQNGFARIRLEVEPENVRARALYGRIGYVPLDYCQMIKEVGQD